MAKRPSAHHKMHKHGRQPGVRNKAAKFKVKAAESLTTQAATTQVPMAQASTTQTPMGQAATPQAATTQTPMGQAATPQVPMAQASMTQTPTAQTLTAQTPTAQVPTAQMLTTQTPTAQASTKKAKKRNLNACAKKPQAQATKTPKTGRSEAGTSKAPRAQVPPIPTTQMSKFKVRAGNGLKEALLLGRSFLRKLPKIMGWFLLLSLYFFSLFLLFLPGWIQRQFGGVPMDNLLFHLLTPQQGTPIETYVSFAIDCILSPLLILIFTLLLPRILRRFKLKQRLSQIVALLLALLMSLSSVAYAESSLGMIRFFFARFQTSTFIEDHYVDTKTTPITFPEKKRNLIFIWAESMEASFQDTASGGCMPENVIVPLTELSKDYDSFSINDRYGGFLPVTTATFTIGGMTTQGSGLPFITPFSAQNETPGGPYMPGMTNLGDILLREGYKNVFLSGSNADFGRQQELFIQHGDYAIHDLKWMYNTGVVPRSYFVWWGVEDSIVLETAKDELERLAAKPEPFNLQLELMDTHAQDGYLNDASSDAFDDQYSNVLAGSARQIKELVDWVKEQPWGADTTIVVVGDHLTMDSDYSQQFVKGSRRSIYNCFIQAAAQPAPGAKQGRLATSLDIFPTTLAALGAKIEGEKLALGTNLYSGVKTLAEEQGLITIDTAFNNRSTFYEKNFLGESWLIQPSPTPLPTPEPTATPIPTATVTPTVTTASIATPTATAIPTTTAAPVTTPTAVPTAAPTLGPTVTKAP